MLDQFAPWAGLFGLIGFAGLAGLRRPIDKGRPGLVVRLLALVGFGGLAGFWIVGVGAIGAAGALGLWNHQDRTLRMWGRLGWLWLIGLFFLARHLRG